MVLTSCSTADPAGQLGYAAVARLLELPVRDAALPARTACPVCRGRLDLFHDTSCTAWHHCWDCGRTGDLAELAAAAWETTPPAALERLLSSTGTGTGTGTGTVTVDRGRLAAYMQVRARRQELAALVQAARDRLKATPAPAKLRTALRLAAAPAACAPLFGVAAAKALTQPLGRTFKGAGWQEVLLFPFETAPGRPAGLYFIGRQGRPQDRVYRALPDPAASEAGLYGLAAAYRGRGTLGPATFAVADAALAARLQLRHAATSAVPLPLVAWHDVGSGPRTDTAWDNAPAGPVVFWAHGMSAPLLRQAIRAGGRIALAPVRADPAAFDHLVRTGPPAELLARAAATALPWPEALEQWAEGQPPGAVADLALALHVQGMALEPLLPCLGRAAEALLQPAARRVVQVGAFTVREDSGAWEIVPTGGRSQARYGSDCVLRIDRVLAGENALYQGRLLYRGRELPFECPAAAMEARGTLKVIEAALKSGAGRPEIVLPRGLSLATIAVAFHPPETFAITAGGPRPRSRRVSPIACSYTGSSRR